MFKKNIYIINFAILLFVNVFSMGEDGADDKTTNPPADRTTTTDTTTLANAKTNATIKINNYISKDKNLKLSQVKKLNDLNAKIKLDTTTAEVSMDLKEANKIVTESALSKEKNLLSKEKKNISKDTRKFSKDMDHAAVNLKKNIKNEKESFSQKTKNERKSFSEKTKNEKEKLKNPNSKARKDLKAASLTKLTTNDKNGLDQLAKYNSQNNGSQFMIFINTRNIFDKTQKELFNKLKEAFETKNVINLLESKKIVLSWADTQGKDSDWDIVYNYFNRYGWNGNKNPTDLDNPVPFITTIISSNHELNQGGIPLVLKEDVKNKTVAQLASLLVISITNYTSK